MTEDVDRRRSPQWIRDHHSRVLHAMALRLRREMQSEDLSEGQEWLFDAICSELQYRHRHPKIGWNWCECLLCENAWDDPWPF